MDMENNMTKVMIQIDGETIEANAEQVAYIEEWKAEVAAEKAVKEQELAANAEAKSALLAKLGITDEEAKLLLQ
jgi:hypothetical protein